MQWRENLFSSEVVKLFFFHSNRCKSLSHNQTWSKALQQVDVYKEPDPISLTLGILPRLHGIPTHFDHVSTKEPIEKPSNDIANLKDAFSIIDWADRTIKRAELQEKKKSRIRYVIRVVLCHFEIKWLAPLNYISPILKPQAVFEVLALPPWTESAWGTGHWYRRDGNVIHYTAPKLVSFSSNTIAFKAKTCLQRALPHTKHTDLSKDEGESRALDLPGATTKQRSQVGSRLPDLSGVPHAWHFWFPSQLSHGRKFLGRCQIHVTLNGTPFCISLYTFVFFLEIFWSVRFVCSLQHGQDLAGDSVHGSGISIWFHVQKCHVCRGLNFCCWS